MIALFLSNLFSSNNKIISAEKSIFFGREMEKVSRKEILVLEREKKNARETF